MSLKVAIVVALAVAQTINCLPFGVPPQACQTMSPAGPAHEGGLQNSPLPYNTILSASNIKSTGNIVLTVKSRSTDKISGIMVQARDSINDQPIGTFQVNDPKLKTIGCSAQDDTVSHANPDPVDTVSMTWSPPANYKGPVQIYVTVAATRTKFWVKQKIPQAITVN